MYFRVLVLGSVALATSARAEPVRLMNDALKELVPNSQIEIDTPLGTKLPIRFSKDGLVSGESQELAALLGSARDRGRWWIADDKLCSKWFRWFDAEANCITVHQEGTRIHWKQDDGKSGTATLIEPPPVVAAKPPPKIVDIGSKPAAPQATTAPTRENVEVAAAAPAEAAVTKVPANAPAAEPAPPAVAATGAVAPNPVAPVPVAPASADAAAPATPASVTPVIVNATADEPPAFRFASMGLGASLVAPPTVKPLPEAAAEAPPQATEAPPQSASEAPPQSTSEAPPRAAAVPLAEAAAAPKQVAASNSPAKKAAPAKAKLAALAPAGVKPKPKPKTAAAAKETFRVSGVERDDFLNVRLGPSSEHENVGSIPPDARGVEITGACVDAWCPVRHGKLTGWANRGYLASETAVTATSATRVIRREIEFDD